jgi:membrane protein DedA with SNARE-associated domain
VSFEALREQALGIVKANLALAEPFVAALGFAEGIPGLSLMVPSSALFLAVGGMHSAAGGAFWHVWLAAAAGATLGDIVTYSLGRRLEHSARLRHWLRLTPEVLARGHAIFERWGPFAVLGGKFTGFLRPFIPIVAGIARMPFPLFVAASAVSSLAWAGAFLAPGYGLKWLID